MARRHPSGIVVVAALVIILSACGTVSTTTPTPTSAPTRIPPTPTASAAPPVASPTASPAAPTPSAAPVAATPAVTAGPATPPSAPLAADRRALPDRAPDMTTGARSDGWVLDGIDASANGGSVSLTLHFEPLPGQAGGPQADAWFEASDTTYSIAVRGVRGANLVLRPGEVTPLTVAPLRGYYALPVRDDTIFALVVVAARPATAWTMSATDAPGVLRLTLETR
jgi:hypothetical protein